jgi:hypothetical protein
MNDTDTSGLLFLGHNYVSLITDEMRDAFVHNRALAEYAVLLAKNSFRIKRDDCLDRLITEHHDMVYGTDGDILSEGNIYIGMAMAQHDQKLQNRGLGSHSISAAVLFTKLRYAAETDVLINHINDGTLPKIFSYLMHHSEKDDFYDYATISINDDVLIEMQSDEKNIFIENLSGFIAPEKIEQAWQTLCPAPQPVKTFSFDDYIAEQSAPYTQAEKIKIAYFVNRTPISQGWIGLPMIYHLDTDDEQIYRWAGPMARTTTQTEIDYALHEGSIQALDRPLTVDKGMGLWLTAAGDIYLANAKNPFKGNEPPQLLPNKILLDKSSSTPGDHYTPN